MEVFIILFHQVVLQGPQKLLKVMVHLMNFHRVKENHGMFGIVMELFLKFHYIMKLEIYIINMINPIIQKQTIQDTLYMPVEIGVENGLMVEKILIGVQ